jgi:hypothetical protein
MPLWDHDALQRIRRDQSALLVMDRAWHAAQCEALERALAEVGGSDGVDLHGRRGEQLLLVLGHAAALAELPRGVVAAWADARDIRPALAILSRSGPPGARVAALLQTPPSAWPAVWAVACRLLASRRAR